jgi:hypothetical protein
MNLIKNINDCIGEIVDLIAVKIGNEKREINPIEAISSCANLVGLFMFLSFGIPTKELEQGSVLLSEQANEIGPKVINRLGYEMSKYGLEIDQSKIKDYQNPDPKKLPYVETLKRIQIPAIEIMKKHNFSHERAMIISISATAFIIYNLKTGIDLNKAYSLAIYGIVEASKTVPLKM